ncbi:MAG: hypothetical protein ACFB15_14905, partial [Cyclobacteriaceae bacterium]
MHTSQPLFIKISISFLKDKTPILSIKASLFFVLFFLLTALAVSAQTQAVKGELPIPSMEYTSETLNVGIQGVVLENNGVTLEWEDGELAIYFCGKELVWSSGTKDKGNKLSFRKSDGLLVIKDEDDKIIWTSSGTGGETLSLSGNKNLSIADQRGQVVWETGTAIESLNADGLLQRVENIGQVAQDLIVLDDPGYQYLYLGAEGADGGRRRVAAFGTVSTAKGGAGATIKGIFEIGEGENMIPPGSVLRFIVGQKGASVTGTGVAASEGGAGT